MSKVAESEEEMDRLVPKSGELTDLQRRMVLRYSNPEWWKSKFNNGEPITSEYNDADWWSWNKDEAALTYEEAIELIAPTKESESV